MNIEDILFTEESISVLDGFSKEQLSEYGAYLMGNADVAYKSDMFLSGRGSFNSCFVLANLPERYFQHTFHFNDNTICVHLEEIDSDTLLDNINDSKQRVKEGQSIDLKNYDPEKEKTLQDMQARNLPIWKRMLRKVL
jgi:hypothetical protein